MVCDFSKRVFLLGGGSSLKGFDFDTLANKGLVVGINKSIWHPLCDMGVSIDQRFMLDKECCSVLNVFTTVRPLFLCPPTSKAAEVQKAIPKATLLQESKEFTFDASVCHRQGGTSGYAALDIIASHGARDIVLLGFDYRPGHYHEGYSWDNDQQNNWVQWAGNFGPMSKVLQEAGVKVVNASPNSRISCFPKVELGQW